MLKTNTLEYVLKLMNQIKICEIVIDHHTKDRKRGVPNSPILILLSKIV